MRHHGTSIGLVLVLAVVVLAIVRELFGRE